ncbi:hypothetical protein AAFF_G00200900 [Aldrovandia affinis]|uniref:Uncharacterized protein n=1 Tax=Aldrovandia affinis TaxID=143900 RepID=A0AAD7RI71_9TELE|nr:hypothetical protein AAFF_G00200900 [Aldrovandia affinis]
MGEAHSGDVLSVSRVRPAPRQKACSRPRPERRERGSGGPVAPGVCPSHEKATAERRWKPEEQIAAAGRRGGRAAWSARRQSPPERSATLRRRQGNSTGQKGSVVLSRSATGFRPGARRVSGRAAKQWILFLFSHSVGKAVGHLDVMSHWTPANPQASVGGAGLCAVRLLWTWGSRCLGVTEIHVRNHDRAAGKEDAAVECGRLQRGGGAHGGLAELSGSPAGSGPIRAQLWGMSGV